MDKPIVKVCGALVPIGKPQKPQNAINFTMPVDDYIEAEYKIGDAIRTKKWSTFFRVARESIQSMQVIPDRTARNYGVHDLARAMAELFTAPLSRVSINEGIQYRPQESFSWDMTIGENICYWLSMPQRWEEYATQKVNAAWPKATVIPGNCPAFPAGHTACSFITLKNHDFYSIATNRNDNKPLESLFEALKDLKPGDFARIQVIATPADRQIWQYEAMNAYHAHRTGKPLKKRQAGWEAAAKAGIEVADSILGEVISIIDEFISPGGSDQLQQRLQKQQKQQELINNRMQQDAPKFIFSRDFGNLALRNKQGITDATIRKISEPVFAVGIRIAVISQTSLARAEIICRSIAAALNELATTDNELYRNDVPKRNMKGFLAEITEYKPPKLRQQYSILSAAELGKLMQLPGAELQQQYSQLMQINMRESKLPQILVNPPGGKGIWLGMQHKSGKDVPIYIPINNHDDLCHPYAITGEKGTGKSSLIERIAYEALKCGHTPVILDPAMGLIRAGLEKVLKPEQLICYRLGMDKIGIDWREARHGLGSKDRLADALQGFVDAATDVETGVQTANFMRAAAKAAPNGKLNEMIKILTNDAYRQSVLRNAKMRIKDLEQWEIYNNFSKDRKNQILLPILNRLAVIEGNDYLSDCMETEEGIDFVELLNQPPGKVIILDMRLDDMSRQQINIMGSLLMTKLDLAMALRKTRHPVWLLCDEPHQYTRAEITWRNMVVEARKWRFVPCFFFQGWHQLSNTLAAIMKDAGPNYIMYACAKHTYQALKEEIEPFEIEEAMQTQKHYALCRLKFGGGLIPTFMLKMAPPPSMQIGLK